MSEGSSKEVDLAWWCQSCREVGMIHCSDPIYCGGMIQLPRSEVAAKHAALRHGSDSETANLGKEPPAKVATPRTKQGGGISIDEDRH